MVLSSVLAYVEQCSTGVRHGDVITELFAAHERIKELETKLLSASETTMTWRRRYQNENGRATLLDLEVSRLNAVIQELSRNSNP